MATSIDVNLPRSHAARFPDRCVVCGCDSPTSQVRVSTSVVDSLSWLFWWLTKSFTVKAPACSGCAWKLHGLRTLSLLVTVAICLAAFWFVWPYFDHFASRSLRKLAMIGLALVCLLPQILFEMFFAPPFNITAFPNSVDYEFTSGEYAVDFATCNWDAAWVKVNDEVIDISPDEQDE